MLTCCNPLVIRYGEQGGVEEVDLKKDAQSFKR